MIISSWRLLYVQVVMQVDNGWVSGCKVFHTGLPKKKKKKFYFFLSSVFFVFPPRHKNHLNKKFQRELVANQ